MEEIVNKVAQSALVTIDLEQYYPQEEIAVFDLKDYLFMELILKEKDYRAALQAHDWEQYRGKPVTITCTADAIIPFWAYMLPAAYLEPIAARVGYGDEASLRNTIFLEKVAAIDANAFLDQRVIIKGCADKAVPEAAYVEITRKLRPVVKSLMYGEPCSTVPVYKKK